MAEVTTTVVPAVWEPGTARIKSEFLADIPPRKAAETSECIEPSTDKTNDEGAPPPKKKRRGQNKHRPWNQKEKIEDCLCPSLVKDNGVCTFGEKCRFIHDVEKFMAIKPDDIADECCMFKTHGKCSYRFACRFGSSHIKKSDADGSYVNIENAESLLLNPLPNMINNYPRELRRLLRKKKYSFPKSAEIFKKANLKSKGNKNNDEPLKNNADMVNPKIDKSVSEVTPQTEVVESSAAIDKTATDINAYTEAASTKAMGETPETSEAGEIVTAPEVSTLHLQNSNAVTATGSVTNEDMIALKNGEKRTLKFDGKLFLAPLTTVGNLPFRVVCKSLGADITCGEMAMATGLLQGNTSEWALLKRHPCEDIFGVQICGSFPDSMTRCVEMIEKECEVDFVDINMGCPIDLVFHKGAGSALMQRTKKLFDIVESMKSVMTIPLTCKMRTGVETKRNTAHTILPKLRDLGISLCTVHGRSKQARYTKHADWEYLEDCARVSAPMPLFGNGDILSFEDYDQATKNTNISGVMIARGALIKPWIFTEIKEQRHWDISSSERFDILKKYVNGGLMHWGSDTRGVETTRRFLLEWLSFMHRYIPVGVLEQVPQKINEKPPTYMGRNDLETLMADRHCEAWVELSEMLLGKVPEGFQFLPKHKANSYN